MDHEDELMALYANITRRLSSPHVNEIEIAVAVAHDVDKLVEAGRRIFGLEDSAQ